MDLPTKASCWCCELCVNMPRQNKLNQRDDSNEVFLSATNGLENKHVKIETLKTNVNGTDSDLSSLTSKTEKCDQDLNSKSNVLSENDINCDDDDLKNLPDGFCDSYPLKHVYQVMNYHPKYFTSFIETHHFLMRGIGPLPYDQRCYIGIMASARHHCSYLVKSLASSFLLCGGDERWLAGLDQVPKKLRNLCQVNRILAHRPWMLSKQHIEKLTKGTSDNWSISELTQAFVLLAHFHSLSSFVFACGISLENEQKWVQSGSNSDRGSFDNSSSESDVEIDRILERMKLLSEDACNDMTQEELRKRFKKIESQATQITTTKKQSKNLDLLRFMEDTEFTFEDFAKRDPNLGIQTFLVHEYCWEDHGYSLMSVFYTEIATLLDDKFHVTKGMTPRP